MIFNAIEKKEQAKQLILSAYQSADASDLYDLIKDFMADYGSVSHPGQSTCVYRLRNNKDNDVDADKNFVSAKQFWVAPKAPLNRVNIEGQSALYCASDESVCMLEAKAKAGDILTICEWKVNAIDMKSINMGFRDESIFKAANGKLIHWGAYRRKRLDKTTCDFRVVEFVDKFLFSVFTNPSDKFYKISGMVGKLYLDNKKGDSLNAISYPSVKLNGKGPGVNWVFSPDFARKNMVPVRFCKYIIQDDSLKLLANVKYGKD